MNKHGETSGKSYKCEICNYRATYPFSLLKHKLVHELPENRTKFACDQCDKTFSYENTVNRHIMAVHEGVRFPCAQCTYIATSNDGLTKHVQSQHGDYLHFCKQCDYQSKIKKIWQIM